MILPKSSGIDKNFKNKAILVIMCLMDQILFQVFARILDFDQTILIIVKLMFKKKSYIPLGKQLVKAKNSSLIFAFI